MALDPEPAVVRVFRARVKPGDGHRWRELVRGESIPRLREAHGLLAYYAGESMAESDQFVMITVWRDLDALRLWAGPTWNEAVLYGDEGDVVDAVTVDHYDFFDA